MPESEAVTAVAVPVKPQRKSKYTRKTISSREYRTLMAFIEGIKDGSGTTMRQAAIQAGYSPAYAGQAARSINEMMSRNDEVRQMMENHGIGLSKLVKDIKEISEATCPPTKYDPAGLHPDFGVRQRNVEFRAEILDVRPPKRLEVNERHTVINVDADMLRAVIALKGPPTEDPPRP
jgi:hypothetical protein